MYRIDIKTDDASKDDIIQFRKKLSELLKQARTNAKHDSCLLCGKKVDGFCNSHAIPQMCLKNIASDGKLDSIFSFLDSDVFDRDTGINNAGTFHIICNDCDNRSFQKYENVKSYIHNPQDDIELINQIALKTILRDIYKHELELEMFKLMPDFARKNSKNPLITFAASKVIDSQIEARKLDLDECYKALEKCKNSIKKQSPWLDVLMFEKLNYVVPIAYQGMIPLTTGFDQEIINNKFSYEYGYNLEYIHIVVLPFEKNSIVCLLMDKENTRYKQFSKRFIKLLKTPKIHCISYLLFLYCEDYYFSKHISPKTKNKIRSLATSIEDIISIDSEKTLLDAIKEYDLNKAWEFPNILGIHK